MCILTYLFGTLSPKHGDSALIIASRNACPITGGDIIDRSSLLTMHALLDHMISISSPYNDSLNMLPTALHQRSNVRLNYNDID